MSFREEPCLVTGATGFVGSHLVDSLIQGGASVSVLVRRNSNLQWLRDKPVQLLRGDILDAITAEVTEVLKRSTYVFHAAGAIMALRREDYFKVNADGTRRLLAALRNANGPLKRFVLISSLAAAGPGTGDALIGEDQEPHPVSWYGSSKLEAERIAHEYGPSVPFTIVRPPPVYGPRDYALLPVFRLLKRGLTPVVGRGSQTNFVYITDLIEGILLAARSEQGRGEIFHIGALENCSATLVLNRIVAAIQRKTITLPIPMPLVYLAALFSEIRMRMTGTPEILSFQKLAELKQANWSMDISKARRILHYDPRVSIEEGGRLTYEWYQRAGWL
ncbi:MAG: NAD(P)-dependent oxidoreductase [Acidobacteriota bacterium]